MSAAISDVSYLGNVLLSFGTMGAFFAGRKAGHQANEAQGLTIEAQSARLAVLESEKGDLEDKVARLLETQKQMQTQLDLLKELVLRGAGNSVVVPPGTLPNLLGGGRTNPPANPQGSGHGGL